MEASSSAAASQTGPQPSQQCSATPEASSNQQVSRRGEQGQGGRNSRNRDERRGRGRGRGDPPPADHTSSIGVSQDVRAEGAPSEATRSRNARGGNKPHEDAASSLMNDQDGAPRQGQRRGFQEGRPQQLQGGQGTPGRERTRGPPPGFGRGAGRDGGRGRGRRAPGDLPTDRQATDDERPSNSNSAGEEADGEAAQERRRGPPPGFGRGAGPFGGRGRGRPGGESLNARHHAPAQEEAAAASGASSEDDDEEYPACAVCTDPLKFVAVGKCNHKHVCHRCTLRLRLCYNDIKCPLCKTELTDVVITRHHPPVPDFAQFEEDKAILWQKRSWAKGVLVADARPEGSRAKPLHVALLQMTARACPTCDSEGRRPFPSDKLLLRHVEEAHNQRLCQICLLANRRFHLELEARSPSEQQAHLAEHPRCEFCDIRFYNADELFQHMHDSHFTCQVCQRLHAVFQHFNDAQSLIGHLRKEHHLCEERDCENCFVAFGTAEELRQHHLRQHSRNMPRWDGTRARPLELDLFVQPSIPRESRRRRNAPAGGERENGGGPAPPQANPTPNPAAEAAAAAAAAAATAQSVQREGGMAMIDDNLGFAAEDFPDALGRAEGPGAAAAAGPAPSTARQGLAAAAEAFPSLSAGAAAAVAGPGTTSAASASAYPSAADSAAARRRPPPLVKVTVKCPCGRRVSHFAVEEGQRVPELSCDAECARQQRSSRLADAFGIEDPGHYVPFAERNRIASYSASLIQAAQADMAWVRGLERQFTAFLADRKAPRLDLPPMPKPRRAAVHELAGQYGMASQAYGTEPQRFVKLFKAPTSSVPTRLLTEVAAMTEAAELAELQRRERGLPLRLVDVSPAADIDRFFWQWDGRYSLEWESKSAVIVRFKDAEAYKAATDTLAGGVRGVFRVDRAYNTTTTPALGPLPGGTQGPDGGAAPRGPSRPQAAAASTSLDSAAASGWQQVRGGGRRGGGGGGATAQPVAPRREQFSDPWEEDDARGARGRAAAAAAAPPPPELPEDWEEVAGVIAEEASGGAQPGEVAKPNNAPLNEATIWDALGEDD